VENKQQIEKMGGNESESANGIGQTVKCVLLRAQLEKRIVVGLNATVKTLAAAVEGAVFCFIAPPKQGDPATLMHEVLLQAFCFENDIYVIKVRSFSPSSYSSNIQWFLRSIHRLTVPRRLADYWAPQRNSLVRWSTAPTRRTRNGKFSRVTKTFWSIIVNIFGTSPPNLLSSYRKNKHD
jgi:Ribosomal protein L7Ae/L30e/S12e/Gadd45 family